MLNNMTPTILNAKQPGFYSNWCRLMLLFYNKPYEIAIMGKAAADMKFEFDKNYLPDVFYLGGDKEHLPLLEYKMQENRNIIYVCKNKVCKFPVEKVDAALKQID